MKDNSFLVLKVLKPSKMFSLVNGEYNKSNEGPLFYYCDDEAATVVYDDLENQKPYSIYILVFVKDGDEQTLIQIYSGTCQKDLAQEEENRVARKEKATIACKIATDNQQGRQIFIDIQSMTDKRLVIDNFMKSIVLNLKTDFKANEYLTVQTSSSLLRQMQFILNPPYQYEQESASETYLGLEEEEGLHGLAQRNEYCKREYSLLPPQEGRSEFQRDYERIVHSKAFRRIVDKAQIFSSQKGDHYRTRMTHTLAVAQIACGIAKRLNLNTYLTEAIALGHDLGHTPFGHQGERTLDQILNGSIPIIDADLTGDDRIAYFKENPYGGFKHNYQSLRVVTQLEEVYIEVSGLDLSYQCLDGMLKHTKCNEHKYSLSDFASADLIEYISRQEFPLTLEGQVVAVADEIAQRSHDLEDAFASGILTYKELVEHLDLKKCGNLRENITCLEAEAAKVKANNRRMIDEDELLYSRVASRIIHYFIDDVVKTSEDNIESYNQDKDKDTGYTHNDTIDKKLIAFSSDCKFLCEYLENLIKKKVINSLEVSRFDHNGATIVRELFRIYYENPRLLHRGTLQRILREMKAVTENIIDFEEGCSELVQEEWAKIIHDTSFRSSERSNSNEYFAKRKILVRNIADFISGMTDSYAIEEYRRYF